MKPHLLKFITRGLMAASGGPVVLAIIYGILGANGAMDVLTPGAVCKGILSITVLAFLAGGISVVYQIERLPLCWAALLHGLVLYAAYILMYLINGWLASQWGAVVVFTAIFVAGYAVIWGIIYWRVWRSTAKLNAQLGYVPSRKAVACNDARTGAYPANNKRLLVALAAIVILSMFTLAAAPNPFMWTPLDRIEECKGLFDTPVEEIKLYKYEGFPVKTEFEDEDLISWWTAYFDYIEVRRESFSKLNTKEINESNMYIVTLITETGTSSIAFLSVGLDCKILIDNYVYVVKGDIACPFKATYDASVARHGDIMPWD